jgi:lysophospholipase L1-like esterase
VTRRGLVALGDSITRGRGGTPALGVHFQSWAQWLAEAMDLPLTNLAEDGAVASDVRARQVPRLEGPYDLATLYVGVNDTRGMNWEPERFAGEVAEIVAALRAAAERVVVLTLPEDLGRPAAAPKPAQANAILRALDGVELVELAGFGGRACVLPDAVHPTSVGMLALAVRVAAAIGAPPPDEPLPEPDLRYSAWWWRLWLRDVLRRARERRQYRP